MTARHHRRRETALLPTTLGLTGFSLMGLALAALLLAGCAGGPPDDRPNDGPGRPGGGDAVEGWRAAPLALLLGDLDADRNRIVTRDELDRGLAGLFRSADSDGSGALTPIEYRDWATAALGTADAPPGRLAFDANGDGRIDPAEFDATLVDAFRATDRNGDGRIVRTELVEFVRAPERSGGRGPSGMPGRPPRR